MNKSILWLFISIGVIFISSVFILGSFVAFSFGVPNHASGKEKLILKNDNGSEELSCGDVDGHSVYLYHDNYAFQCGYKISTDIITYLILIIAFAIEIASYVILKIWKKKRFFLVSLILSILVPIGLGFLVYLQSADVHGGSDVCSTLKKKVLNIETSCSSWLFIISPVITSITTVITLVLPVLIFYVRCIKHDFKDEDDEEDTKPIKEKRKEPQKKQKGVAPILPEKPKDSIQFGEINNGQQSAYQQPAYQQPAYNPPAPTYTAPTTSDPGFVDFSSLNRDN